MRLVSLELDGFRGFSRNQKIDLNADAIVVTGANGYGKTSLLDSILWALSGCIPRLKTSDSGLLSMYSQTGQMKVSVGLKDPAIEKEITITRSFDGKQTRISVQTPDGTFQGPSAEGHLIRNIWPDAASASDTGEAMASVITQSVYLQQDVIRDWIEAATDQQRFTIVSELVGAGRVTELQADLEREKRAWSTTTNQQDEELRPLLQHLAQNEARLSEMKSQVFNEVENILPDSWKDWWKDLASSGLGKNRVEMQSRDASSTIDLEIKQIDALRRTTERRIQALNSIRTELSDLSNRIIPDNKSIRDNYLKLQKEVDDLKSGVQKEKERLAEERKIQSMLQEKTEQLRALAIMALKHLDEKCPVCNQDYDKEATQLRLEEIATGPSVKLQTPFEGEKLGELINALAEKENAYAKADNLLRSAERTEKEIGAARKDLDRKLCDLEIKSAEVSSQEESISNLIMEQESLTVRLVDLQKRGESFALRLAHSSALAIADELSKEAIYLRQQIGEKGKTIISRNKTGDQAQAVIEALREASSAIVNERLGEIGPLLQNIYGRIDPHPTFRMVSFMSKVIRGKGQLSTVVSDPIERKQSESPGTILSSSQVNALAVAVFLSLNLGVPRPPLSTAILDDPLQNLDDVNLLGLIDLLRRVKDRRQLIVSTHDVRLGNLFARKLRPRDENGRTLLIELDGWDRNGPLIRTRTIKSDPVPLRLVAS